MEIQNAQLTRYHHIGACGSEESESVNCTRMYSVSVQKNSQTYGQMLNFVIYSMESNLRSGTVHVVV